MELLEAEEAEDCKEPTNKFVVAGRISGNIFKVVVKILTFASALSGPKIEAGDAKLQVYSAIK